MTGVDRNSGNTQSFSLTAGSAPRYAKEMVNHRPIVMAEPWPLSWLPLFYATPISVRLSWSLCKW